MILTHYFSFIRQRFVAQALIFGTFLTLLALNCPEVAAQVPPLGVTPIEVQHTPRPGSRITDQFIVTNGGDVPLYVTGYTSDWTISKSGTIEFQEPGTNALSCAKWIQIVPPSFSIPPHGQVPVRYTITTPRDLSAEHQALIFFECRPLPSKGENGMKLLVAARIGCKVFVSPTTSLQPQGKLTGFNLLPAPDNKLAVTFANTGLCHLRASGTIEARDTTGQVVAKGELLPRNVQMPSGTSVDFTPKWDKPLAAGTYALHVVVDYGGKALAGGDAKVEMPDLPTVPTTENKTDSTTPETSAPPVTESQPVTPPDGAPALPQTN